MRERPLAELVALILTVTVCACVVVAVAGVVALRLDDPHTDVAAPVSSLGTLVSVLVGYVVGAARRSSSSS